MLCQNCKREAGNSGFCPNCGAKVDSEITSVLDFEEIATPWGYLLPESQFGGLATINILNKPQPIRLGPSEDYPVITTLPSGAKAKALGVTDGYKNWVCVRYDRVNGWLLMKKRGLFGWKKYAEFEVPCFTSQHYGYIPRTTPIRRDPLDGVNVHKPVIYLYPQRPTDVSVKLTAKNAEISTTYPAYGDGWNVTAYPDGKLVNKADGGNYHYLFWDSVNDRAHYDMSQGFVVKGEDTEKFLREKLEILGLNEDERNEFIVYWLPRMEHNKYNQIAFQSEAYTDNYKLDISPKPDSLLRVFMTYRPLEEKIDIPEQKLSGFERKGFAAVEWGGAELK